MAIGHGIQSPASTHWAKRMLLDLTPLKKATEQLELTLAYCDSDLGKSDLNMKRILQMAAIQAFAFTYELCWKMLRRYLEASAGSSSGTKRGSSSPSWKNVYRPYD